MDATGLYLYGIARLDVAGEPLHSTGVQLGGRVEFLVSPALSVAVSQVPLQEFSPQQVQERLKAGETRWVEEKALAHAAVLQEMMQRGAVVPLRFGILFKDPGRLLSLLAELKPGLLELLERLGGRVEWGVKVWGLKESLLKSLGKEDPEARSIMERLQGMTPGRAYLWSKKMEILLEEKARQCWLQWAQHIHHTLAQISQEAEALETPVQTGQEDVIVHHEAYLVREEDTIHFRKELERLGDEFGRWGLRFDLSGPWPPFHFARMPLGAEIG